MSMDPKQIREMAKKFRAKKLEEMPEEPEEATEPEEKEEGKEEGPEGVRVNISLCIPKG